MDTKSEIRTLLDYDSLASRETIGSPKNQQLPRAQAALVFDEYVTRVRRKLEESRAPDDFKFALGRHIDQWAEMADACRRFAPLEESMKTREDITEGYRKINPVEAEINAGIGTTFAAVKELAEKHDVGFDIDLAAAIGLMGESCPGIEAYQNLGLIQAGLSLPDVPGEIAQSISTANEPGSSFALVYVPNELDAADLIDRTNRHATHGVDVEIRLPTDDEPLGSGWILIVRQEWEREFYDCSGKDFFEKSKASQLAVLKKINSDTSERHGGAEKEWLRPLTWQQALVAEALLRVSRARPLLTRFITRTTSKYDIGVGTDYPEEYDAVAKPFKIRPISPEEDFSNLSLLLRHDH